MKLVGGRDICFLLKTPSSQLRLKSGLTKDWSDLDTNCLFLKEFFLKKKSANDKKEHSKSITEQRL